MQGTVVKKYELYFCNLFVDHACWFVLDAFLLLPRLIDEDQHNFRCVNRILSSGREIQRASYPEREAAEKEGFDGREIDTIVDGSQVDHVHEPRTLFTIALNFISALLSLPSINDK